MSIPKGVALADVGAQMVLRADGTDATAGVSAQVSIDGGAYSATTNAAAHISGGDWRVDLTATEMDGDMVSVQFSGTDILTRTVYIKTGGAEILFSGTTVSANDTTIILDANAPGGTSAYDDYFIGCRLRVVDGRGTGQELTILTYNGVSRLAVCVPGFADSTLVPEAGDRVEIVGGSASVQAWVNGAAKLNVPTGLPSISMGGILDGALSETSGSRLAGNFGFFYDNSDAQTAKVVDNVGAGGGGGLTAQQTRDAMQLTPTGVTQTNSLDEKLDDIATTGGSGPWTTADVSGLALEASVQTIITTGGTGPWTTADVSGLALEASVQSIITTGGTGPWTTADVSLLALEASVQTIITTGGAGPWTTGSGGGGLTQQEVADAMRLTPTGTVQSGSVDEQLGQISTDIGNLNDFDPVNDEVKADMIKILGQAIPVPSSGNLGTNFSHWYDVATPQKTMNDAGVAGSGLSQQDVADAMRLTPAGTVNAGSVDEQLGTIITTGGPGPWTGGGGGGGSVSPKTIASDRTWRLESGVDAPTARNIITLNAGDEPTLAMDFADILNPGTGVQTVDAVIDTLAGPITIDTLLPSQDREQAHFDVSGLQSGLRYKLKVSITTTDGQPLSGHGTLQVN